MLKSQRGLKNKIHHIEVKPKPNHSARHHDSNGVKVTHIQARMLKIFTVKVLVKLG